MGCAWTYYTINSPSRVKTCGQLPDVYPPDGCMWTDNVTILKNQMDRCLEPLRKARQIDIQSYETAHNYTLKGISCCYRNLNILVLLGISTICFENIHRLKITNSFSCLGDIETMCGCHPACKEYSYYADMSSVSWPSPGIAHQTFANFVTKNIPFREWVCLSLCLFESRIYLLYFSMSSYYERLQSLEMLNKIM